MTTPGYRGPSWNGIWAVAVIALIVAVVALVLQLVTG